jgi:hypothetical protein
MGEGKREIWVVKINPTGSTSVSQSPEGINDRRNEMVGLGWWFR